VKARLTYKRIVLRDVAPVTCGRRYAPCVDSDRREGEAVEDSSSFEG
jgi:hypothetical protein